MKKKRKGMMSLGIAMWMLLFSIIAGTVIYSLSANLMASIRKLDLGKEERYSRIVMKSMVNGLEAINRENLGVYYASDTSQSSSTTVDFRFVFGSGLAPSPQIATITFSTCSTMVLNDDVEVFDILTTPSTVTEQGSLYQHEEGIQGEGIIIQLE